MIKTKPGWLVAGSRCGAESWTQAHMRRSIKRGLLLVRTRKYQYSIDTHGGFHNIKQLESLRESVANTTEYGATWVRRYDGEVVTV